MTHMFRVDGLIIALSICLVPVLSMIGVNELMGHVSAEQRDNICTRACHTKGELHDPALPRWLTGPDGIAESVIDSFEVFATELGVENDWLGYQFLNLLIFALVWPGCTFLLIWIVISQRFRLCELREEAD